MLWRSTYSKLRRVHERQLLSWSRLQCASFTGLVGLYYYCPHALTDSADTGIVVSKANVQTAIVIKKDSFSTMDRITALLRLLDRKLKNMIMVIIRCIHLMYYFSPAICTSPLLLQKDGDVSKWWWALLRDCIRKSGPFSTKLAQWISTRPDLFPLSLCKNFDDLQSNASMHSWTDTEKALILAFGDNWKNILQIDEEIRLDRRTRSFKPVVLGSGCVAQVLRGQLDGRPVAIKIIHPGVRAAIEADVAILRYLGWLVEIFPGAENLSLSDCVEEFSILMMQQLDMKLEADNLERFRENFRCVATESGNSTIDSENIMRYLQRIFRGNTNTIISQKVTFPQPFRPLVTADILVESYEPGRSISETTADMNDVQLRKEIATAGLDAILKMVFEDNFIHADLHPGNVLYHEYSTDGTDVSVPYAYTSDSSNNWRLSFIDAGLVSTLDKQDRKNFVELFSAVVVNNGKRVGELMVDRSRDEGAKCIDREKFCFEIGELVNSVHVSGLSLGKIGIGYLLQKVLVLCYTHQVKLEPKFVSVMVALGVVEGLGKRLDPDVDVLKRAAPYVFKAALFA